MAAKTKRAPAQSIRQSVTLPASLAADIRRVAKERHVTMSRALVALAERGVKAEAEAKQQLKVAFKQFLDEKQPTLKSSAGRDLIRSIFGDDAIAEDSVR